jgi:hypothetical protein
MKEQKSTPTPIDVQEAIAYLLVTNHDQTRREQQQRRAEPRELVAA